METTATSSGETAGQSQLSPDAVSYGKELFADLADTSKEISSVVRRFLKEIYSQDVEVGEYTLIEFIFLFGGYKCNLTKKLTKYGYPDLVEYVTKKAQVSSTHPLLGRKSKKNAENLSSFISELITQSKDSLVIYDECLLLNLVEFLRSAALTGYNNLRYTSTFFAMKLLSALIDVQTENQKLWDRHAENLQDALDSKQASQVILMQEKALRKKELYETRLKKINRIVKYLTTKNFLNAFRDVWQPIQLLSIKELVVWVHSSPKYLISLGKYVIQASFDSSGVVRLFALKTILVGLDAIEEDDDSEYEGFFKSSLNTLQKRALDANEQVAVLAIQLIGRICKRFPSIRLSREDERNLANLMYAERRKVARMVGILMRDRRAALKGIDFILWLAQFHAQNVEDFPTLFYAGTEALLLASLPENCAELTDWEAMMAAATESEPNPYPLAVIIAAAVERFAIDISNELDNDNSAKKTELKKMTTVFLTPLASLLGKCKDLKTIAVYLQIINHMDAETMSNEKRAAAGVSLMKEVSCAALSNCSHRVLSTPCAAALGPLIMAGNASAKNAADAIYRFGTARLTENLNEDSESALEEVEASLCLLVAFGHVMSVPITVEEQFLEILKEVANDASLSVSKWSPMSHAYAINALYYDFIWGRLKNENTYSAELRRKADFLDTVINAFFETEQESQEATKIVVTVLLDLLWILNLEEEFNNPELLLKVSEYLEKNVFARKDDLVVQEENRPILVVVFKLLLQEYMDPAISAIFYKNFTSISEILRLTIADLHRFYYNSDFHSRLYPVILSGFKKVYVDQCPTEDNHDLEFSTFVTELANTSALVCSWLMPDKKATKNDYEVKSEKLFETMSEIINNCIASSETMASFCEVLVPFADKLIDTHKKKMLKLVIKGFAGMSSLGVKKFVGRLRMQNTELDKLKGKSTTKVTEEIPPSPIERQRHDGSRYTPLPLRSERRPSSSSHLERSESKVDQAGNKGFPLIISKTMSSDTMPGENTDPEPLPDESSDPKLFPAENDDSMLEEQHTSGTDADLQPKRCRKPQAHSTMIEKPPRDKSVEKPNPTASPYQPKPLPGGSSSSKTRQATTKNMPGCISYRRKLSFVPLPIQTSGVQEEKRKKINVHSTLQENIDSIHEYPACSLAKKSSPAMVIAADSSTDTSDFWETDDGLARGQPKISSKKEGCVDRLPCDANIDHSISRAGVTSPNDHRTPDGSHVDMSLSYENAPTQKRSMRTGSSSQVLNSVSGVNREWSTTANAGSYDKISPQSSSTPQSKERSDVKSNSSKESGLFDNTNLPKANSAVQEHELSLSIRQSSGSSKGVSENEQNVIEKLLVPESSDDEPQICTRQPNKAQEHELSPSIQQSSGSSKGVSENEQNVVGKLLASESSDDEPQICTSKSNKGQEHEISPSIQQSSGSTKGVSENEQNVDGKLLAPESSDDEPQICTSKSNKAQEHELSPSIQQSSGSSKVVSENEQNVVGKLLASESSDDEPQICTSKSNKAQEHELSPSIQQSSGSSKGVSENEQNVVGKLLASESSDDEPQICTSKSNKGQEHELSPSIQQSSGSSKGVSENEQNVVGKLLAPESSDDESQICTRQRFVAKSSDSLNLVKGLTKTADECCSDNDSEDFIPSSQLCSISPDVKPPPETAFDFEGLISEDESEYEDQMPDTSQISCNANILAKSGKKIVVFSSPTVDEMGDIPADNEKDNAEHFYQATGNFNLTMAELAISSQEISGEVDLRTEDKISSEDGFAIMQNEQASENSSDENSCENFPEEAVIAFSPEYAGRPRILDDFDSDGDNKTVSNHPFSESESDGVLDSSESEEPDSGQKALECLAGPSQEPFRGLSSLYLDCRENESRRLFESDDEALLDSEDQASQEIVPSSCEVGSLGTNTRKPQSVTPLSVVTPQGSLIDTKFNGSKKNLASEAKSSEKSPPGPSVFNIKRNVSAKSPVASTQSTVTSPVRSSNSGTDTDYSEKSVKSPNYLMTEIDEPAQSQVSIAPSLAISPPNSLMNEIKSDESAQSKVSIAPSLAISPPNSLMNEIESDESTQLKVSVAPSSITSPPNSLMTDIESDGSDKSLVSVAPSSVMSPPNSLMNEIESDESTQSKVSVAPSSVTSPPNSLMTDIESDGSDKSLVSVAPSSVMSPPNSLMNEIESDESSRSKVSVAPSSVTSPPNSLMTDIESDGSDKSLVSVAPSSVMSPPNSLFNDIENDGSEKSVVCAAPSCVSSPPDSLMNYIEDEESTECPSVAASPPDSLMSDVV